MLNIARDTTKAIKYMNKQIDFFVVKDESNDNRFYEEILNSLEVRDKNDKSVELDLIEKSININVELNINRLLDQLVFAVRSVQEGFIKLKLSSQHTKEFEKIVNLSEMYKISLLYDERILFEFISKK